MEPSILHRLSTAELVLLAEHLKLGEGHLQHFLSKQEIAQMRSDGNVPLSQLQADSPETAGKALLLLNTGAMGSLGVLLGYADLLGISPSPFLLAVILGFSFFVGGWVGYQNFQSTKRRAADAIHKQQINSTQMEVLEALHKKKQDELHQIQQELSCPISEAQQQFARMAEPFHHTPFASIFQEASEELARLNQPKSASRKNLPSFLQKLLTSAPILSQKKISWWSRNRKSLAVGLIPTLFGGLGFCLSVRGHTFRVAAILGSEPAPLSSSFSYVQIFFTLIMTLYFVFSFLHENWKDYLRDADREKLEDAIIEKESILTLLDAKLTKMRQAQAIFHRGRSLIEALQKLPQQL